MTEAGTTERTAEFERGFVALRALLCRRGEPLVAPLVAPTAATRELAARLGQGRSRTRAARLAAELARLAYAIESRRLGASNR